MLLYGVNTGLCRSESVYPTRNDSTNFAMRAFTALIERVARSITTVAVISHTGVRLPPIRILPLVERAAGAEPAVSVVGHALNRGLFCGHGGRHEGCRKRGQDDSGTRQGERTKFHGSPPSAMDDGNGRHNLSGSQRP